jgi:diaminohydroxyphosphoribosylaminopyrimidine deaminase/5-amino-6-(5-phosphoribosylamino)uracil reductase
MLLSPQDEAYLSRALDLAGGAVGLASPNPTVGCVLAAGARVLGEGAHHYEAMDHAEIAALKQAAALGHSVRGATAYVTLEPCSHHGRTGPCADALIVAGIARCVVATVDPNPLVRGGGIARLRAAGVEVAVAEGALADRARRLNDAFAWFIQHARPFVTLKAALSVDGMLAPPAAARDMTSPHWITGEAARLDVQALRHASDAILTGIGTVLADDPSLTDRTGLARRRPLLRVVLDGRLRMPLDGALVRALVRSAADDLLVLCGQDADVARERALRERGVDVQRIGSAGGRLDLAAVLSVLAERKMLSVLVEAGSAVNGGFLARELVDRVVLYFAERELGVEAVPFAAGFASPYELQRRLTGTARATFANAGAEDVRVSGYLHDPWNGV